MSGDISQRKLDHIAISLEQDVNMRLNRTGFERFRFKHQALPELCPEDINLETTFLGHHLAAPILISSMTGGPARGETINANLARAAQKAGTALALGSQRIIFERPETLSSFQTARANAPDALIFANVGAVQLNYHLTVTQCIEAVECVGANGLFLHLNPLQEMIQPEGDTDFRGLLAKIKTLTAAVNFPVLVKEVGCGISAHTAYQLAQAGVQAVDVSGAGGTSWAKIEAARAHDPAQRTLGAVFAEWGIPTVDALIECRAAMPHLPLIASGGVRTGLEAAKALALGADLVGFAMPFLGPATRSSEETEAAVKQVLLELRTTMFLLGIPDIATLRQSRHLLEAIYP
ncbi:MAG: type 2 isopentenyl-diphosphate Delta-isomerase [Candidatus Sericytochromatia bacterium]|nr:type 2 isopentenyl-diphosphate Delta-isomerase [Candidatus Sericytochromatia bacterium]